LTQGRLVLGIGAGWKKDEFLAYGFDFDPPPARVKALEETAEIIRRMWTESPASFQGKHYHIANAYCEPRPNPPPPLMIGTTGEKRALRVVAKYADWWNGAFLTVDEFAHKLDVLRKYCVEEKRDEGVIKKTLYAFIRLSENPSRLARSDDPYTITGTPDAVTRELEQFRALGMEHLIIRFVDFPATEGLELFLQKVMPRLV
jgi:alkanesulfonate monooxygenase SsuD/methylene tetrahydromethanopterin reductase-like flavin-dependent oxidoreductase (luciferase family)